MKTGYETIQHSNAVPIKAWTCGISFEKTARQQVHNIAGMPIIFSHIAVMPDVHYGKGATVGSVIASVDAVIPAAVGVDIGCGMVAARTSLGAGQLPDSLKSIRQAFEAAIPHGRTANGRKGRDQGAWSTVPAEVTTAWQGLEKRFQQICDKHPEISHSNHVTHLGTMGSGNHFLELCLDENQQVWVMLHSGSRGVGNRIGSHFIELAKQDMRVHQVNLPDQDLAYLREGTRYFDDYVEAVAWAQDFAHANRAIMLSRALRALSSELGLPLVATETAVNCHHNYISREQHFGQDCYVTRKGAVRAGKGELGIIPGSMGTRSYIVRGLGNPDSFCSCSHGAGRVMSRNQARKAFSLADHAAATQGIECRKDADVIDETPGAYKDIDQVMAAQRDLVEVVHTLKQVVCVKG